MPMPLWEAQGRVLEIKPNASKTGVTGFINRRIRNVIDTRRWADLLAFGVINCPNKYDTGTVDLTAGSDTVNGTGTAWPVDDYIDTTLVEPIVDSPGYCEFKPASMALIAPGIQILLDVENASVTEVITVVSVGAENFFAQCRYQHETGVSMKVSSLAGLQFRTSAITYTVKCVTDPERLKLDMPFGGPPQTAVSYLIYKSYCKVSSTARRIRYAWDSIAGRSIGVDKNNQWLTLQDPQRTSSGNPLELAQMPLAPGGVMQWELWPTQYSVYQVGIVFDDGWPTLAQDNDYLPFFINPEVFIAGACADALRGINIASLGKQDPYHNPVLAREYESDYERLLEIATQSDQGRYTTFLSNYREKLHSSMAYNWMRDHAVSAYGTGAV